MPHIRSGNAAFEEHDIDTRVIRLTLSRTRPPSRDLVETYCGWQIGYTVRRNDVNVASTDAGVQAELILVQNWFEELRRRVPAS